MKNSNWKDKITDSFKNPQELLIFLGISAEKNQFLMDSSFKFSVPRAFADKMEKRNSKDPLLLQAIPRINELEEAEGYKLDAVDDTSALIDTGIIKKYKDRALLITSNTCAMNCRFCFRRNLDLSTQNDFLITNQSLNKLKENFSLKEIILSGGDPLTLSNSKLKKIVDTISEMPNIKRIRIHSRMLSIIPERLDEDLIQILSSTNKKIIIVNHINHANELSQDSKNVFNKLKSIGATLLNQSVLLKDINDNVETLCNLSEKLIDQDVLPYYLHQLDKAKGAHHFEVSDTKAKELIFKMKEQLSGYLVPLLVREIKHKKTPL